MLGFLKFLLGGTVTKFFRRVRAGGCGCAKGGHAFWLLKSLRNPKYGQKSLVSAASARKLTILLILAARAAKSTVLGRNQESLRFPSIARVLLLVEAPRDRPWRPRCVHLSSLSRAFLLSVYHAFTFHLAHSHLQRWDTASIFLRVSSTHSGQGTQIFNKIIFIN